MITRHHISHLALLTCCLAFMLGAMAVHSAEAGATPVLWHLDFDEQKPGDVAKGWEPAWGEPGDNTLTISNRKAANGTNSLLLDRKTGQSDTMWGMSAKIPDVSTGWAVLSFDFLVLGSRADVNFGFEVRGTGVDERIVGLAFSDRTVSLVGYNPIQQVRLGGITSDTWYRMTLWVPTTGGKQGKAYARLERRVDEHTWMRVGITGAVNTVQPMQAYGCMMVNTAPGKRNYQLFLDDCQLAQSALAPSPEELAVRWKQDFEDDMPGSIPQGWQKLWGEMGDDILAASNTRAQTGKLSLLLDRMTSQTGTMWGMGTEFPDVNKGWAMLSYAFLVRGAGESAGFGWEVRDPSRTNLRVVNVGVANRKVSLMSSDWKISQPLGQYVEDGWYRITLWLPTAGGQQHNAYGLLEKIAPDGAVSKVAGVQTVPAMAPEGRYGQLMVTTSASNFNYQLFMDSCQLAQSDNAPAIE
ncbi:MAG TPA: hypothetical protein VGL77_18805 [Armatimonadota bacterium]